MQIGIIMITFKGPKSIGLEELDEAFSELGEDLAGLQCQEALKAKYMTSRVGLEKRRRWHINQIMSSM
jgi:hypothetical protein